MGVNAWFKRFKFFLSTTMVSWAMAWFCFYLNSDFDQRVFNWVIIITLGFEVVYIALQAGRGELSHYNNRNSIYSALYYLMDFSGSVATIAIAYVGVLFFKSDFPSLPEHYVWSIKIGIFIFVIFSLDFVVLSSIPYQIDRSKLQVKQQFYQSISIGSSPYYAHERFIWLRGMSCLM